jgi:hypothetical protein
MPVAVAAVCVFVGNNSLPWFQDEAVKADVGLGRLNADNLITSEGV